MSATLRKRGDKTEVRWREGGRRRSRSFTRSGDAKAFALDVDRRQQLGPLAASVIDSKQTLAVFMDEEWWPRYALTDLAPDTRRRYLEIWGTHVEPRLGGYKVREIDARLVEDFKTRLDNDKVGKPTQAKALMLLQGMMRRAEVRGLIPPGSNPVRAVTKPRQRATRRPEPLAPIVVERIRSYMLTESWSSRKRGTGRSPEELRWWRHRNALIVSLMAYAGLRPIEDRSSTWGDLGGRTLHVLATKTNRERDIDLLAPLVQDLAEWRLLCGRPGDRALIVPRLDGGEWTRDDWNNWRRRVWRPAAEAAGVTGDLRPYRLRGSFVSLLLWEKRDLAYVAGQAGHSIATMAKHYAGVMTELQDAPKVPAATAIMDARAELVDAQWTQRRKMGLA